MNDGTVEDGRIVDCGVCGCTVFMLDPEEMDWICDPCSLAGWSGFKSAWRLTPGDVIHVGQRTLCVLNNESFGKQNWLECRTESGEALAIVRRAAQKVYVHMDRQEV